jgi:hypothetical protein
VKENGRGILLRYCFNMYFEGVRKTTKALSQDSRYSDQDMNPGPPEYEAGVLTTRARSSVCSSEDSLRSSELLSGKSTIGIMNLKICMAINKKNATWLIYVLCIKYSSNY